MDIRNQRNWDKISGNRDFMKFLYNKAVSEGNAESDQEKKLPQPPLGNVRRGKIIELQSGFEMETPDAAYGKLLEQRRSERNYDADTPMKQQELAFLLWSAQGIKEIRGENYATFRPVPSGGARHPFELYFIARSVEGLKQGVYRYAPLEHVGEKRVAAEFLSGFSGNGPVIREILMGQKWAESASVVLLLSCVAYRGEWRYGFFAHRPMLIDLGHVGQNIMLSASALGLGSCCIAAFDQELCDKMLGLDGCEEYTVYACTVGSIHKRCEK